MKTVLYQKTDCEQIIKRLCAGDIIAFPTDTVFGLACVMEEEAITKVYVAKGRDFNKPLPVMCSNNKMIEEIAYVDEKTRKIMDHFMPGALTIVYKKKENVSSIVTQGKDTIGIRMPDDDWIIQLIEGIGKPILVTSANISNTGSLLKWEDVYAEMKDKIDGVVCEDARGDRSSTIISVVDGLKLLREGPIDFKDIENL